MKYFSFQTLKGHYDFICHCQYPWSGTLCDEVGTSCGGDFTEKSGTIVYPEGPQSSKYPPNAKCTWTITVAPGMSVALTFEKFDIEPKHGTRCADYLEIYNGIGTHSSGDLIGQYCGSEKPQKINSESNKMELIFHSDSHTEAAGFITKWDSAAQTCGGIKKEKSVNGLDAKSLTSL